MSVRSVSTAAASSLDPRLDLPLPPPPRHPRSAGGDRLGAAALAPLQVVRPRPAPDPRSLAGLPACVDDVGAAALRPTDGPADPLQLASLRSRLQRAAAALPPAYRRAVAEPLLASLEQLGAKGFARLLAEDPDREGGARLLLDLAQAVLQRGEGYQARATAAFQEVVADLYDGFLSAEDRRGVKPPDHGVLPPLVRWGEAGTGPYTWPATATGSFGAGAAVVSLPAANASAGLLAWAALAHEAAGHDLLAADDGLADELARAVRRETRAAGLPPVLGDYWAERIEETASDVLGVLNMGPASAVGLIGYFRGLHAAWSGGPSLRNDGQAEDPHPADLARAYLAAETVRLLSFEGAGAWADRLVAEADRDLGGVLHLGEVAVTGGVARASAAVVARAIVRTRLGALEGRALGQIQDWRDRDELVVAELRRELGRAGAGRQRAGASDGAGAGAGGGGRGAQGERGGAGAAAGAGRYLAGAYAAHVVAAGVYEAVSGGERPAAVTGRMIDLLAEMHARNPAWAPAGASASPGARDGR